MAAMALSISFFSNHPDCRSGSGCAEEGTQRFIDVTMGWDKSSLWSDKKEMNICLDNVMSRDTPVFS